ncbi:MAG: hypothetical protein FJW40_04340 [Acidobacteria bacterium]|nr:hypothetical protein [Acidobacteriota bacterium]
MSARFLVDPAGNVNDGSLRTPGDRAAELRRFAETCTQCGGRLSYRFHWNPVGSEAALAFWCRAGGILMVLLIDPPVWVWIGVIAFIALCAPYYLCRQSCEGCGEAGGLQQVQDRRDDDLRNGADVASKFLGG